MAAKIRPFNDAFKRPVISGIFEKSPSLIFIPVCEKRVAICPLPVQTCIQHNQNNNFEIHFSLFSLSELFYDAPT